MLLARINAQDTEFNDVSKLLTQKKGGVVAEYFYVNDHEISLEATRFYCFDTWTVEVGEIMDFKANLDGYFNPGPALHFDMKLYKDDVEVAKVSIIDQDTTDVFGLLYREKVTGANANFKFCLQSSGMARTITTNRFQWGYTRIIDGNWWTTPDKSINPTLRP